MDVSDQRHAPAALPPGRSSVTHCTGAWVSLGQVWMGTENSPPPGFELRTVQPVSNRYSDYANPAAIFKLY